MTHCSRLTSGCTSEFFIPRPNPFDRLRAGVGRHLVLRERPLTFVRGREIGLDYLVHFCYDVATLKRRLFRSLYTRV